MVQERAPECLAPRRADIGADHLAHGAASSTERAVAQHVRPHQAAGADLLELSPDEGMPARPFNGRSLPAHTYSMEHSMECRDADAAPRLDSHATGVSLPSRAPERPQSPGSDRDRGRA